jgi:hypothetical protein
MHYAWQAGVRRSICLLFNPSPAIEAASLIEKETVVSYERRRWPEKRPV